MRVLDFSWAASGPLSTLYLSLLGAEVIKVESARSLDIARRGYYTVVDDINASPNFNDMHMGKLSIRLDLRHPKAKELVLRLVALCDAAVENFRPGTLDKFGLGYEALRQARPDLIMVSSSTAGQTGPERAMPGYATTFGALGAWAASPAIAAARPPSSGTPSTCGWGLRSRSRRSSGSTTGGARDAVSTSISRHAR